MTRAIHDVHAAAVVVREARGMIEEGDALAIGRDAQVAEIAGRVEQHRAHGILQAIVSSHHVDDGERRTVG